MELEREFLGRESLGEESVEITDLDRPVQPHQEDPDLGVELGQGLSVGRVLNWFKIINKRYSVVILTILT